jgi:hypothetical protein
MAKFVLVINDVPVNGFNKIMGIVSSSGGKITFIPQAQNSDHVTTQGMSGPNNQGLYSSVRVEFPHDVVDQAAEILKIFSGLPASK